MLRVFLEGSWELKVVWFFAVDLICLLIPLVCFYLGSKPPLLWMVSILILVPAALAFLHCC